eukprot:scaffold952_cov172-Chaetoceros_neogracile.AAC.2
MAMSARNAGHSEFIRMPSTIKQNSHPVFAINNLPERSITSDAKSSNHVTPSAAPGARIHGDFSKQQEQRHNVSVQHAINNRCTGGLSPTRMTRTARRGSEDPCSIFWKLPIYNPLYYCCCLLSPYYISSFNAKG